MDDFFQDSVTEMVPRPAQAGSSPAATILRAIRKRYGLGIVIFVLLAPLAVVFSIWSSQPYYEAEAIVEVNPIRPRILYNTGDNEPGRSYESFFQTQMAKVSSDIVLGKVIDDASVRTAPLLRDSVNPLRTLRKALSVRRIENTQLFAVSVRAPNPEGLATIVNTVIREYRAYIDQADAVSQNRRLQVLDGERKKLKLEVDTKMAAVAKTREAMASDPNSSPGPAGRDPVSSTQESIIEARAQRTAAQARLERLKKAAEESSDESAENAGEIPSSKVQEMIDADPEVKALRQELASQKIELAVMKQKLRESNPSLRRQEAVLQTSRERLAALEVELARKMAAKLRQLERDKRAHEIKAAEAEVESLAIRENALDELVGKQIEQRAIYERKAAELKSQEEDLKRSQQTLLGVEQRLHELEIESDAPGFITIGSTATEPKQPEPYLGRRINYVLVSLAGSFGLALLAIVLLDRRDDRIWTPDDIHYPAGAELLGCVPDNSADFRGPIGQNALFCRHRPDSFFAEQIRNVMAGVLYPADGRPARSVLVTGAAPGDGKTTLAANLATCVAGLGKRVLLVDANFRKPDLARVFDLGNIPGLGDILTYGADPDEVIHRGQEPNLDILTAGSAPSCSAGMLGSNAMRETLRWFGREYDYVIIDGPPLMLADARILAPLVDGVVCSFKALASQRGAVEQAISSLRRLGARTIGVALMGVDPRHISCQGTMKALDAYTQAEGAAQTETV